MAGGMGSGNSMLDCCLDSGFPSLVNRTQGTLSLTCRQVPPQAMRCCGCLESPCSWCVGRFCSACRWGLCDLKLVF